MFKSGSLEIPMNGSNIVQPVPLLNVPNPEGATGLTGSLFVSYIRTE